MGLVHGNDFHRNSIIFGVVNSLSSHTDNQKNSENRKYFSVR